MSTDENPGNRPLDELYGLKLLSKDLSKAVPQHNADIIAVHGLGGEAYKTWTHTNGTMWLRDFLPSDLPGARVFTYGYKADIFFSREKDSLRNLARSLLEAVRREIRVRSKAKHDIDRVTSKLLRSFAGPKPLGSLRVP